MSSTLLSLNCVSTKWTFVSKMWSFFFRRREEEKKGEKKGLLFFKTFAKKRTALFDEDFLLLRIVSTKSINLSLFRTENTQNTNTRSYYIRSRSSLLKSFRFAAAIE